MFTSIFQRHYNTIRNPAFFSAVIMGNRGTGKTCIALKMLIDMGRPLRLVFLNRIDLELDDPVIEGIRRQTRDANIPILATSNPALIVDGDAVLIEEIIMYNRPDPIAIERFNILVNQLQLKAIKLVVVIQSRDPLELVRDNCFFDVAIMLKGRTLHFHSTDEENMDAFRDILRIIFNGHTKTEKNKLNKIFNQIYNLERFVKVENVNRSIMGNFNRNDLMEIVFEGLDHHIEFINSNYVNIPRELIRLKIGEMTSDFVMLIYNNNICVNYANEMLLQSKNIVDKSQLHLERPFETCVNKIIETKKMDEFNNFDPNLFISAVLECYEERGISPMDRLKPIFHGTAILKFREYIIEKLMPYTKDNEYIYDVITELENLGKIKFDNGIELLL